MSTHGLPLRKGVVFGRGDVPTKAPPPSNPSEGRVSTRLSTEELKQRRHKDFFLFLAAQRRVAELEAANNEARRALRDLVATIDKQTLDEATAAGVPALASLVPDEPEMAAARAVLSENPKEGE